MKAYRKRAKGSWNVGKGAKGDGPERQFSKREIQQQLAEAEKNYLVKYRKSARARNEMARLEYRIKWYEERLAFWTGRTTGSMMSYFREALRNAKKDLAQHQAKKKVAQFGEIEVEG